MVFLRSDVGGFLVTIHLTDGEKIQNRDKVLVQNRVIGENNFLKISRLERKQELGKEKAC